MSAEQQVSKLIDLVSYLEGELARIVHAAALGSEVAAIAEKALDESSVKSSAIWNP